MSRPSCGNCWFSESTGFQCDMINCTNDKPGTGGLRDCMEAACACWLLKVKSKIVEDEI